MCFMKWNIEEVKKFVKSNSECILLEKQYINNTTKMKFKCKCGEIFETSFQKFKDRNKRQCNKCGIKLRSKSTTISFKEQKDRIESKTGLKVLDDGSNYENGFSKIKLLCSCGDVFYSSPVYILRNKKYQCDKCGREKSNESKRIGYDKVKKEIESHDCKILTKREEYKNTHDKIRLRCKCGKEFETSFDVMRSNNKYQCNDCGYKNAKVSKGEERITEYLEHNKIIFKSQYSFEDCKYKQKLRFDFAVFDENSNLAFLIEFDGEQHFRAFDYYGGDDKFELVKKRDEIKNNYCKNNNIKLIRIPYNKIDNIHNILKEHISQLCAKPSDI